MKNLTLVTLAVVFVLGIAYAVMWRRPTNQPQLTVPTPSAIGQSTAAPITTHFAEFEGPALPSGSPVRNYEWIGARTHIPTTYRPVAIFTSGAGVSTKYYSTEQHYYVLRNPGAITLYRADDSFVVDIPIPPATSAYAFAWLNAANLVLLEKQPDADIISLINVSTRKKTALTSSESIEGRLDTNTDPQVYNEGTTIFFTATNGKLWQLNLVY